MHPFFSFFFLRALWKTVHETAYPLPHFILNASGYRKLWGLGKSILTGYILFLFSFRAVVFSFFKWKKEIRTGFICLFCCYVFFIIWIWILFFTFFCFSSQRVIVLLGLSGDYIFKIISFVSYSCCFTLLVFFFFFFFIYLFIRIIMKMFP